MCLEYVTEGNWPRGTGKTPYRFRTGTWQGAVQHRSFTETMPKSRKNAKTTPIKLWTANLSGTILFRATQELSGIKYTWTGYYRLPPSWKFVYFNFFQRYVFTVHEYRITVCYGRSQESSCWKQGTRFVRVMKNLKSHEISGILLPGTETRGKLKSLVLVLQMSKQGQRSIETSN